MSAVLQWLGIAGLMAAGVLIVLMVVVAIICAINVIKALWRNGK